METKQIAIATTTYYPRWYRGQLRSLNHSDKIRGDLSLELIKTSILQGYPTVVVDGFSSKTYQKHVQMIAGIIFKRRTSLKRAAGRRLALTVASKIPHINAIVLTEPEKIDIVSHIQKITDPILKQEADIVIPKRNDELFHATYPEFQYYSEVEGNKIFNEFLHLYNKDALSEDYDMFFGPKILKNDPNVLRLFLKRYTFCVGEKIFDEDFFDPEQISNALFFPIVLALNKGLRVKSVEIPFRYPKLQRENEEIGNASYFQEKRRMQRLAILIELMHFSAYLSGNKRSKVKEMPTRGSTRPIYRTTNDGQDTLSPR